ncbi:MAG: sulfotransferase family protein [Actinomycetota bacterium]
MDKPPFFVVGSPRSGTSLLRVMLDGHPRLAVPPESHFIVGLAPRLLRKVRGSTSLHKTLDDILGHERFQLWGLDVSDVRDRVLRSAPTTYSELIDVVFSSYAEAHGKSRWGDKTPGYVSHLPTLDRLFPTARFIHIIRDGREAAASMAEMSWGPPSPVSAAFWWRSKVEKGRACGRLLSMERYFELRLEDLIEDPEEQLQAICDFLEERYSPAMLDYPSRMTQRVSRPQNHHLTKPPTPGLRDWKAGLSAREQRAIDAVCRGSLQRLGYRSAGKDPVGLAYARSVRFRDLLLTTLPVLRARLSTSRRF